GRRAVGDISLDTALEVRAIHDGYLRSHGVAVERHVLAVPDGFVIREHICAKRANPCLGARSYLHFHLSCKLEKKAADEFEINDKYMLRIKCKTVKIEKYHYCHGYNWTVESTRLCMIMDDETSTLSFEFNSLQ